MEDKVHVTVRLALYVILVLATVGLLVALRLDVGKDAFYTGVLIVGVILLVFAIQAVTAVGGRMAQRSDNVEIAMAGAYKAAMEYASTRDRAQVEQVRVLRDVLPSSPQFPALTFDDGNDEPVFAAEDGQWVGSNAR